MHAYIGISCPSGLSPPGGTDCVYVRERVCDTEAFLVVLDSWSGQWGRPARVKPRVGRPQPPNATWRLFSDDSPGALAIWLRFDARIVMSQRQLVNGRQG